MPQGKNKQRERSAPFRIPIQSEAFQTGSDEILVLEGESGRNERCEGECSQGGMLAEVVGAREQALGVWIGA